MKRIKQWILHPKNLIIGLFKHLGRGLSDQAYVRINYFLHMGKVLHLSHPETFNEKLNWLKLYDHQKEYTVMVDKYAVKAYVASIIGEEYIIPTIGVWDTPDEIDFDGLPSQFVLKTTHGGGNIGVFVCKDKTLVSKEEVIAKMRKGFKQDLYKELREWPYKNVPHRVIAETYLEDSQSQELQDYKFFCMDGKVRALFVASERQTQGKEVKFDFFDSDFNHLNVRQKHPMSSRPISRPSTFDQMKVIAEKLSKGIPHVRVDLYDVNGHVYFGELTFTHHGGIVPFVPEKWDYVFGEWISLPKKKTI